MQTSLCGSEAVALLVFPALDFSVLQIPDIHTQTGTGVNSNLMASGIFSVALFPSGILLSILSS